MYERIVVLADLLRPWPTASGWVCSTWKQTRWLWSLVAEPARQAGCEATMLCWDPRLDPDRGVFFDAPRVYQAAGEEISMQSWARLSTSGALDDNAAREMLLDHVADALVVGYEMPDSLIALFAAAEIPFIDVVLHPVRFLDDLVFALRSNVPAIHDLLRRTVLTESEIRQQASLIQAKGAWLPMPVQFPPGTALILGQVETDRAVAKSDGSFHTLGDHLARLHELCCDHPKVLFKAHPYVQDRNKPPCRETIRKLPAIQMIDGNFYHLLCQPEIVRIVALNSSGLIEAPYFGKTAEALIPFLYDFGEAPPQGKGWPGAAMPQRGSWIEPWFWQSVLAGDAHAPEAATARGPANRLRRTMNADWGYSYIERVIS